MPFVYLTLDGDAARLEAQAAPPFGPGLTSAAAQDVFRLHVVCSSFTDPGEDWTRYVVLRHDGHVVKDVRVQGH